MQFNKSINLFYLVFLTLEFLTVYFYDVAYAFQSESTLYSCLNVKELLAQSRRKIWLSVHLWTKWLWVRVQLQSLKLESLFAVFFFTTNAIGFHCFYVIYYTEVFISLYSLNTLFIETNSSWLMYESIKDFEIRLQQYLTYLFLTALSDHAASSFSWQLTHTFWFLQWLHKFLFQMQNS